MIDRCLDWQRNGLIRPQSVISRTAEYFDAQDLFGQWVAERCDCEPGNRYKTVVTGEAFSDSGCIRQGSRRTAWLRERHSPRNSKPSIASRDKELAARECSRTSGSSRADAVTSNRGRVAQDGALYLYRSTGARVDA